MHKTVLPYLHPEHVEIGMACADDLAQRRGLTSALDERWSAVGKKVVPRWWWHALDPHTGTVVAEGVGRRKDTVFLELQGLLKLFGITRFSTDGWAPYARHITPEQHGVGEQYTHKIARTHINVRTLITRLIRRTMCFSTMTTMHELVSGLFIKR